MRNDVSRKFHRLFSRSLSLSARGIARTSLPHSASRRTPLESLEPRQLLAADAAVTYVSTTLPSQVVYKSTRGGVVTAQLANLDSVKGPKTRFNVVVQLVPAGQTQGRVVGTLRNQTLSTLSGTASRTLRIPVVLPGTRTPVDKGIYSLVVIADPTNKLGSAADTLANNTSSSSGATTPFSVTVADPFTRLSVVNLSATFPTNAAPGSLGTATLSVRNDGNVTARGTLDLSFFGVSQGSSDQVQISDTRRIPISLSAGVTRVVAKNVRVTVPANTGFSNSTLAIVGRITPNSIGVPDTGTEATRQDVAPTTVTLPPVSRTDTAPLVPGLGNILTFTIGTTSPFGPIDDITRTRSESNGNVVDNNGRVGKYTWLYTAAIGQSPAQGLLTLTFPGNANQAPFIARYRFSFTSATPAFTSLAGRSFTLGAANPDATLRLTSTLDVDDPNDPTVTIKRTA